MYRLFHLYILTNLAVAQQLTMRNIVRAIREVLNWSNIGTSLGVMPYKLEEIRINRRGDVQECKFSLIDHWLRTDVDASWEKLASALDEANEIICAGHIRRQYLGGGGGGGKRGGGGGGSGKGRGSQVMETNGRGKFCLILLVLYLFYIVHSEFLNVEILYTNCCTKIETK